MFECLGLEPVHQELLPLEAHLQAEPAQLLVTLRDRLHAGDNEITLLTRYAHFWDTFIISRYLNKLTSILGNLEALSTRTR